MPFHACSGGEPRSNVQQPPRQAWKGILHGFAQDKSLLAFDFDFKLYCYTIMSWARESAKVGLAGLTPGEAARGAMFLPVFQDMPDPLHQAIEIKGPDDVPIVSVSIACRECQYGSLCVQYST